MINWDLLGGIKTNDPLIITKEYKDKIYIIKEKDTSISIDEINQSYDEALKEAFYPLMDEGKLPENIWLKREDEVYKESLHNNNEKMYKQADNCYNWCCKGISYCNGRIMHRW